MTIQFNPELYRQYREIWNICNNAGEGYAIGNPDDSPEEACEREGWEILHVWAATDQICIARTSDGRIIGVGDGHGPWAVDLARAGDTCTRV